jgi:multiple sugar transport system permease protein
MTNALQRSARGTAARGPRRRARRPRGTSTTARVLIVVGLLLVVGPLYWMVTASFKNRLEVTSLEPTLVPKDPTVENYAGLVTGSLPFPAFFFNSIATATVTAVVATFICTLAGYSFSRGTYRLRGPFSLAILGVQMLPFVVLIGPLYLLMLQFNLLNTYFGLILGYTTFALPFGAWMMKGFIDAVPKEIEEAARVDGYSRLGILVRVVMPLTVPGLATTAVLIFINSWNNLLYPLTLMTDTEKLTLPPGLLQTFSGQYQFDWGGMMAATTVTSIPLVIAFFAVQRYMVRGLTAGAMGGT